MSMDSHTARTYTYNSWKAMKARCLYKKSKDYRYYGGRGIVVCDRWKDSFQSFVDDMGLRPYKHYLDRIDNDGNYCKENCRWITHLENCRNRSNSKFILFNNKRKTILDWCKEYNKTYDCLRGRLRKGWSVKDALTIPQKQ